MKKTFGIIALVISVALVAMAVMSTGCGTDSGSIITTDVFDANDTVTPTDVKTDVKTDTVVTEVKEDTTVDIPVNLDVPEEVAPDTVITPDVEEEDSTLSDVILIDAYNPTDGVTSDVLSDEGAEVE